MLPTDVNLADAFDALNDAAVAAEHVAMPLSKKFEYGGFLVECDGKFYYTRPMTSHKTAEIYLHAIMPKTCTMSGMFHTHPGVGSLASYFSETDIKLAAKLNVPSYIGVTSTGEIHQFVAGRDKITYSVDGQLSLGEIL